MKKKLLALLCVFSLFVTLALPAFAAGAPSGIYGNGTSGIYIDINAAPYTTFANYSYGQYAYTKSGCAWFASARVRELTGKGSTIRAGTNWWRHAASLGYSTGQTIRAKSLACYENHVTVVESVNGQTATISEGGYKSVPAANGYCRIATMPVSTVSSNRGGAFLGYVYLTDSAPSGNTYYRVTATDGLWMRSQPSTSGEKLRVLPYDAIIEVTQVSGSWGYGSYCGTSGWFSLNYATQTEQGSHNPKGSVDSITGGFQKIELSGWALDLDNVDAQLLVQVYKDDLYLGTVTANAHRPDVDLNADGSSNGQGAWHGFSGSFQTNLVGAQTVQVYAVNVGGGYNTLLGSYDITIQGDTTPPEISNVAVSGITEKGYTISCTVRDDYGVDRVQFPTWTVNNGQDDLAAEWWTNPAVKGSTSDGVTYTFHVNAADHNNETGTYLTDIYAYDTSGNSTSFRAEVRVTKPTPVTPAPPTPTITPTPTPTGKPGGTPTKKPGTSPTVTPKPVTPAKRNGWYTTGGKQYWYENGVKQGTTGRGKEIFDRSSNAWYWLDAVQGGAKAVSKDVYQDSAAGPWADHADGTGKWVRYDANGHMVKGWQTTGAGKYYFDKTYGTMAKGYATINGIEYYFNAETGILESTIGRVPQNGWKNIGGKYYWYENSVRQGYSVDPSYRGKEIYDPGSYAWYWLDNVQGGAKAVSKDVYQDSAAGEWADNPNGTGKWVRYDANGHMIKGWQTTGAGTYYFDPVYGTMAKGSATINGKTYRFDPGTGILQ